MKLSKFLNLGILFCAITAFSQNVASTATLTSGGLNAGTSGTQNAFYGSEAGKVNTGNKNTFLGNLSGKLNTTGYDNTFVGTEAGTSNSLGRANTYIGNASGNGNNGNDNTFLGASSGDTYIGNNNTLIGTASGVGSSGNNNTFLGSGTGTEAQGSGNVYIGNHVGSEISNDNKLFIDNTNTIMPLIWGDFAQDQLKFNGKVGIGYGFGNFPTTAGSVNVSNYNLFVKGGILTEEVRVNLQGDWADYVFSKDYELMPLQKIEIFIKENGHLPNMPSAKQVKEKGIELGQIAKMQQEKIEELTLHMIEQNKTIEKQSEEIKELKELVKQLIEK
ncbi:MAG: hypothetical protein BGO88_07550 [Flavobacterium sp. 38-13]|uniref:hypothetical protein n=1 Tax=Flavobacterium sp. 38-13 TaxID=1896168 RepID=UPI000966F1EC|nr:hypothetical protein [Flavobacterium sp. 38-13]OJX51038.1 MAG: hypothetical protein BGO88_07550 [Flavobacterium sp. 38-13]